MFFPTALRERAQANIAKYDWAKQIQQHIVQSARPWRQMSDEALWELMFGHTIKRSWMVWSNGYCPACKEPVPMYNWQVFALKVPWKVRCPHCSALFPKNDFHAFYRSGLDEHGVFDPRRSDRSLLFNAEHPDPNDPLRRFGVDDGEGYVEDHRSWRFIGTYLVYGQWKQAVLGGIEHLAAAYGTTGDPVYAHKAGVLLDRVADLYPTFDFGREGVMYEGPGAAGYVSTWHDACEETRALALAYDMVYEALREDKSLVAFLSRKAQQFNLSNPKASFGDVQRNIETRILQDALQNSGKIRSNYPRTDIALATIETVLGWPDNREEVHAFLDAMLEKATAVDGVTGEKGLAGYSSFTIQGIAGLLGMVARLEPDFLREMLKRHPRLHDMVRFHIDTWCLQQYYPLSGDCGAFARKIPHYVGVRFSKGQGTDALSPSMFTLLWQLYELTGDEALVQVLYHANDNSVEGLPHDLCAEDPAAFRKAVHQVIARHGSTLELPSVHKPKWCLALLRSGAGAEERVVWLDYDAGGGHGHYDCMNLGMFAKGLDLMPDFGYPPVHYGGWSGPKFSWYLSTAAHNTVVVDGNNQQAGTGYGTLWADGERFHAVRASAPNLIGGRQYERTAALVDLSERHFYVLDVFRVVGGTQHDKFMHSSFGSITTQGLSLKPAPGYGGDAQMRGFFTDPLPQPGWRVDWKIEDRYGYLPEDADVHIYYTDLTSGAQAYVCEGWISAVGFSSTEEVWIPRVMVRRRAQKAPLASAFVAVIEPYERASHLAAMRRLSLQTAEGAPYPEAHVAVEIAHQDGARDLVVAMDTEHPLGQQPDFAENRLVIQSDWLLETDAALCFVRVNARGQVERVALCTGQVLRVGEVEIRLTKPVLFIEIRFVRGKPEVTSGDPRQVAEIRLRDKSVWEGQ